MRLKGRVLIVDDEPNIRKILQAALERTGLAVETAESGEAALKAIGVTQFDLVITDVMMPGMSGIELLKAAKQANPDLPFIVMTAYGSIPQAVDAVRAGAADYLTKPFDLEAVKKTAALCIRKPGAAKPKPKATVEVIAESPAMKALMDLVTRVADSRATVLITGESGTGKEVIAKAIHRISSRSGGPFVAVNCAALPETLLESELFGHEKGAYTGADTARAGRFELADSGTLFLDEIGEVPPSVQVKLLRVLQEREIVRLGSGKPTPVDVRLVAATNRDLQAAVAQNQFREDLFFRLQVLHLEIAPLRERREDILPLANLFAIRYAEMNSRPVLAISAQALAMLEAYRWPGNVRELENAIERAVVLAPTSAGAITADLLPPQLRKAA